MPKQTHLGHLLTGSIASTIARTSTCPLERLRILQQTGVYSGNEGIFGSLQKMYGHNGISGLFRGNFINCAIQAPFTAIEFFGYEFFKNNLYPDLQRKDFNFQQKVVCGGFAGMIAGFVVYPADVVKTFITLNQGQGKSMYSHTKTIFNKSGISGFYKGLVLSSVGIAPFIGFRMSTYDMFLLNPTVNRIINKHP